MTITITNSMKHFSTFGAPKFAWIKFIIYCYSHNPFAATLCSHFRFHYSSHFALSIFRSSWCFKHTQCAHSVAVVNRETQWLIETPHVVWGLQMFETENDFQYNSSDSTQKKNRDIRDMKIYWFIWMETNLILVTSWNAFFDESFQNHLSLFR